MTNTMRMRGIRALFAALLAFALISVALPAAHADTQSDLEQKQQANSDQREKLQASLEGVDSDLADVYLKLKDIDRRLPVAHTELDKANSTLASAQREAASMQDRLDVAKSQQSDLKGEIASSKTDMAETEESMGAVARSAYRGGQKTSMLSVILSASSPEEFVDQYSAMSSALRSQNQALTDMERLEAVNRNRQTRLDAVEDRIGELKVQADAAVDRAAAAQQRATDLVNEIESLKQEKTKKASKLEKLKDKYKGRISKIRKENKELSDRIAKIEERNRRQAEREASRAAQRSKKSSSSSSSSGSSSSSSFSGSGPSSGLKTPIPGPLIVTSPWGMRNYPFGGYYMHNGVDLHSPCWQKQHAAAAGTVAEVNPVPNGTHGNQVIIDHGFMNGKRIITVYNHMYKFAVHPGQHVSQGQTIGYTGATGLVTGCHVHFEVWVNGKTINPMTLPGF